MRWRRINKCNPPRGTVTAGNLDLGSVGYDKVYLGRVFHIAGTGIFLTTTSGRTISVTHYLPMSDFDVIARYEPCGDVFRYERAGAGILAVDYEHAKLVADLLRIPCADLCPTIEEIDASDVGGRLGSMINKFDPSNN